MDVRILIAFVVAAVSIAVSHGTGNQLYTSFHCKDGSSSTCSGHNLRCDAGKKIFIVTTQYIFATTESSCPIKSTCRRTGCCFDYSNNDLCATDYTSDDLRNVLSKCHTKQSCTLSTPAEAEHAKCKKSRRWWHPRSKMFNHYAMSYISYECLPDPPTIKISNPTSSIGVKSGNHMMIKGSLKKGVSCWFAIANIYFFLVQTNNEKKSIQLSHGNLLSDWRYLVKISNRRSPPKLMVHGPITDLMIELMSMRHYRSITITWECSGAAVEESITIPTTSTARPTTSTARPTTSSTRRTTSTARPTTTPARPTTSTARPTTSTARPTPPTARPTTSTTRPTTSTARPTPPTARPTTSTARPTTSTARPTPPTARPTTSTARPTTSTSRSTTPTARPTIPVRPITSTTTSTARSQTTPAQIVTTSTTEEDEETIITDVDNTKLEDMFNISPDEDLEEIQGEIVVSKLQSSDNDKGPNLPVLIGGAVGGFLLLIIITFTVALFCKRRSDAAVALKAKDVGTGVTNPSYGGFEPNQYIYENSKNDDASSTFSDASSRSNARRIPSAPSVKSIPSHLADMNAQKSIDLNM
ncbi:hypothetical protein SNE40_020764 [Patella caerulea]|uniref:Uncharacterized protein n=1 Tax=Patella caerulea TaxID=87958 RepID=A0AAN8J4Y4_PATCE